MADKCGGIWLKNKKDGERFLSIEIDGKQYVAWKNDKGDNPKRPDFTVYPSAPRDGQQPMPRVIPPKSPQKMVNDVFGDDLPPF